MKLCSIASREEGGFWPEHHCCEHSSGRVLCIETSMNILWYRIDKKGQSE